MERGIDNLCNLRGTFVTRRRNLLGFYSFPPSIGGCQRYIIVAIALIPLPFCCAPSPSHISKEATRKEGNKGNHKTQLCYLLVL